MIDLYRLINTYRHQMNIEITYRYILSIIICVCLFEDKNKYKKTFFQIINLIDRYIDLKSLYSCNVGFNCFLCQ